MFVLFNYNMTLQVKKTFSRLFHVFFTSSKLKGINELKNAVVSIFTVYFTLGLHVGFFAFYSTGNILHKILK